ncbi:MAG: methyltransferase [Thermoplasmata archaeon]|nr:methyltransferase [Thermoplasmata archaeon]
MIEAWVELSRENLPLARWELRSAVEALGGEARGTDDDPNMPLARLVHAEDARVLAGRLALARRIILRWPEEDTAAIRARLSRELRPGESVAFRPLARARGRASGEPLAAWAEAVQGAGGRVDLDGPDRRFAFESAGDGRFRFGEQVAEVDRSVLAQRRMPRLPFRRPVSLPPKLGRVAVNLARVRPGDRVVDPFLGTGALAVESALLGARVTGLDTDATMVRGALANFAHLALEPESVVVADSGSVVPVGRFDALVTDPPYGRASTTGGEVAGELVERVVRHWAEAVRADGRLVVVMPGGPDPVAAPWRRLASIPDRVHRSLTREFRVYERDLSGSGATAS